MRENWAILVIMIARLKGDIIFRGEKFVVIEAGGIGYRVFVLPETRRVLAKQEKEPAEIWTHLHVREDAQELYGFLHYQELEFFERLIQISGVGPRSAMNVLAAAPLDTLRKAIAAGDASHLTRVSGIGRRTAEKIIIELRDSLGKGAGHEAGSAELREEEDIFDALAALGYAARESREVMQKISPETVGREARLKEALRLLGGK